MTNPGYPDFATNVFEDIQGGKLSVAKTYSKLWELYNDSHGPLTLWSLNAPSGFRCLGMAATKGEMPQENQYCCVTSALTSPATLMTIHQIPLNALDTLHFFRSVKSPYDFYGIQSELFIASNKTGDHQGYVLDSEGRRISQKKPLALIKIYKDELAFIWNDLGSNAFQEVSLWTTKNVPAGHYNLGDFVSPSREAPDFAHVIQGVMGESLMEPVFFESVWTDSGSGADLDLAVWKPECPSGFVPGGFVATSSYAIIPNKDRSVCIKEEYVMMYDSDDWQVIWQSKGTNSYYDVGFYTTVAETESSWSMDTFFAEKGYENRPGTPYMLLKSFTDKLM